MVAVPLFYFLFLSLRSYLKKGWNIVSYMYLLYATTSFFACMIKLFAPDSYLGRVEIGLFPTVIYCSLITISICPFSKINFRVPIILKSEKLFNAISIGYIALFLLSVALFAVGIVSILTSGDFYVMRAGGGDESPLSSVNSILRTFIIAFGELSSLMIFFFFYSVIYLKKSKLFNILLLMSSLTMVLLGIMNIDRSRTFYWVIMLGLAYSMFYNQMNKKIRRKIILGMGGILSIIGIYFMAVTISRFDRGTSSVEDSLLSYAGQPFIYFCDFFENYNPPFINFHFFFPNIYHFFIDDYSTAVEIGEAVEMYTGRFVNVFYTFLGSIMLDSGRFFMIIFVVLYVLIVKGVSIKRRIQNNVSFWKLMQVFLLAIIPACGIILYQISSPIMALGYYALMILTLVGDGGLKKV